MMNKYCSFFLVMIFIVSCNNTGNDDKAINPAGLNINARACYFDDVDSITKKTTIKLDSPGRHEIEEINKLMKFTGLPLNFTIYRGNVKTAMATLLNDQRVIVYSKDLFTGMSILDSSYWSAMFIIAHEIGHHLAYNISDTTNLHDTELAADIFASSVLYSMGADSNQVLYALSSGIISNDGDTKTHPAISKRIAAVKQSWYRAARMRYQAVAPPTADDELMVKEFTERNLAFNAIGNNYFYNMFTKDDDKQKVINYFDPVRNLEGTILDVKKTRHHYTDADFKKVVQLKMTILVTHIDKVDQHETFRENHRYGYEVFYEPKLRTDRIKDLYDFFKAGRRIKFDVINLYKGHDYGGEVLTIIKAKVL